MLIVINHGDAILRGGLPVARLWRMALTVNANTDGDSKRSAPLHPALAVVGFVLMMSIGAGVAALVFHDRVT